MPVIANLVMIFLGQFMAAGNIQPHALPTHLQTVLQSLTILSNGFILTALLWGSLLAFLIDNKPGWAAFYACLCGLLALFGVIHSIKPSGEVYLPWQAASSLPYTIAIAYFLMAGTFLLFRRRT
jgi:AGZA family xanthine/uracil permease-like MFS transporter